MSTNLFKSGVLLVVLIIIGKFIGFFREVVIANYFGATVETDCFFLANGLVANILYGLSTALAVAFLPIYTQRKSTDGVVAAKKFAFSSICIFVVVAFLISLLLFIFSYSIAQYSAPSFSPENHHLIAFYLRVLGFGLVFSLAVALLRSLLEAERVYGYTSLTGIISSVTVILFILLFRHKLGILSLVISIPVAFFIELLVLLLRSSSYINVSRVKFIDPAIKSLFLLALPILLSNTTLEINQFINRLLASNLGGGTVSAFSYSGTLSLFVTGTLSLSVVTIYYTEFSHASSVSVNKEQMTKLLSQSTLVIFALVLPVTVLTCFLAGDIVTIAYGRGAFSAQAVSLTARCLFFYSIGFVFIVLKALYNKAFLAMRNSRVPMLVSFCEVCINIAVATLMAPRLGIAGIVIAIPFSAMISVIIMLIILKTKLLFSLRQLFLPSVVKLTLMTLLASLATLFCMYLLSNQDAIVRFCMTCVAVFVFYIGCLYHLRFEGTQVLFAILERFFLKTRFTNK